MSIRGRRRIALWELLFLLLATSWLLAPSLNHLLSDRSALISQYEVGGQPYYWLFRLGDFLAAGLLLIAAYRLHKKYRSIATYLLAIIAAGLMLDPLLGTNCQMVGSVCQENFSAGFVLHAAETIATAFAIWALAVEDFWRRRRLVSGFFLIFQIAYGGLFLTQWANQDHFNTLSQYIYQLSLIIWLAWLVRDRWYKTLVEPTAKERRLAKNAAALWALINGILAVFISLAHIHLLGRIHGLYFLGDNAWLAQHGMVVGVIMIYLSRQLWRGELRARQIFLVLLAVEAVKYSVIAPNPGLLMLYWLSFAGLFVLGDDFDRGTLPLTFKGRLKEASYMLGAIVFAAILALVVLHRDPMVARVTNRSFEHFEDYTLRWDNISRGHLQAALLAHTESAFLLASAGALLWILFRPYRLKTNGDVPTQTRQVLSDYSNSSEDFFKLWPADKQYFWRDGGFIAYKVCGTVAFALADPMSADRRQLLAQFVADCRAKRLTACFMPVYENSLELYRKGGLELLQIGSSAIIDCQEFMDKTIADKWWRWKRNQAIKASYEYRLSQPPHSSKLRHQLRQISDDWLKIGGHEERGFALGYFDDQYIDQCSVHYLVNRQGRALAFANQLPKFGAGDTATVDLMRYRPEADKAMPFLLSEIIRNLAEAREQQYFDLGFVPFTGSKQPVVRLASIFGSRIVSVKGLEQFKNKFDPRWTPNYLAYDGDIGNLATIAVNIEKVMQL